MCAKVGILGAGVDVRNLLNWEGTHAKTQEDMQEQANFPSQLKLIHLSHHMATGVHVYIAVCLGCGAGPLYC